MRKKKFAQNLDKYIQAPYKEWMKPTDFWGLHVQSQRPDGKQVQTEKTITISLCLEE